MSQRCCCPSADNMHFLLRVKTCTLHVQALKGDPPAETLAPAPGSCLVERAKGVRLWYKELVRGILR